jgi:heme exporter protein C
MSERSKSGRVIWLVGLAATLAVLAYGFWLAIFASPADAAQGDIGRAIFYHPPTAILGYLFPYINLAAAITFLVMRTRNPISAQAADAMAIASAEVAVLYSSLTLITGMIWGRVAWGIWWTWDARLTLELLLWLLYVSYLMVRRLSVGGQTSTLSAVLAIFAAVDIPINYMSIRWFRTQHPQPVFGGGPDSGLDPSMRPAFYTNLLAWFMWGMVILAFRYALERRRQKIAEDEALAQMEASLNLPNSFPNSVHGQENPRAS